MFDLYIFDLDGTIVDTERLHFESYKKTLDIFNVYVNFDYNTYCQLLHLDNTLLIH